MSQLTLARPLMKTTPYPYASVEFISYDLATHLKQLVSTFEQQRYSTERIFGSWPATVEFRLEAISPTDLNKEKINIDSIVLPRCSNITLLAVYRICASKNNSQLRAWHTPNSHEREPRHHNKICVYETNPIIHSSTLNINNMLLINLNRMRKVF